MYLMYIRVVILGVLSRYCHVELVETSSRKAHFLSGATEKLCHCVNVKRSNLLARVA